MLLFFNIANLNFYKVKFPEANAIRIKKNYVYNLLVVRWIYAYIEVVLIFCEKIICRLGIY